MLRLLELDFHKNEMLAKRLFGSVINRLHARMNDKYEPVLKAVANLANELSH